MTDSKTPTPAPAPKSSAKSKSVDEAHADFVDPDPGTPAEQKTSEPLPEATSMADVEKLPENAATHPLTLVVKINQIIDALGTKS